MENDKDNNPNVTIVIIVLIAIGIGISLIREKKEIPFCNYQNIYRINLQECLKVNSGEYSYQKQMYVSAEECAKENTNFDISLKMKMKLCK